MVSQIVDIIILGGALCTAIYKIWEFFAKPTSTLKKKKNEKERNLVLSILDEVLPQKLLEHDLETKSKYRADRENYLNEIKDEVVNIVGGTITQNAEDLEALKISARNGLREKIMDIYHKNKTSRTMTEYEREALDQYYKDYKALNGNSYIDKRYNRMVRWEVVYDDSFDDDDE